MGEFQAEGEGGWEKKSKKISRQKHGRWGLVRKVNSLTGAPHTMPCSLELSENGGGATF